MCALHGVDAHFSFLSPTPARSTPMISMAFCPLVLILLLPARVLFIHFNLTRLRKKASALRLRFSQSLASLRQRLS